MRDWPQRIVCLTTETVEVLYLLEAQARIVGISGYTTRPPQARQEKARISAFTSANINKILALQPDLVLCFSDLQAPIAARLIAAGCQVHVFNQRSLAQTLQMIRTLGQLVGATAQAQALVTDYQARLAAAQAQSRQWPRRPRIYFEEWDAPMMSGIRWVSELIEAAGGDDCFAELRDCPSASQRQISTAQVLAKQPDIIIASWCGKKCQPELIKSRPGWQTLPAVKNGHVYEIKSVALLQPGPALFLEGLPQLQAVIQYWQQQQTTGNRDV